MDYNTRVAVAEAVAHYGQPYMDSMGKTVYFLTMPAGKVPDSDIVLGDAVRDWRAWVTDAHGENQDFHIEAI